VLTVEIKRETSNRLIRWTTIGNMSHKYRSPAYTSWYDCGQKCVEEYRVNDQLHREPTIGPAYTFWNRNGQKYSEECRIEGKLIRGKDFYDNS